MPFYLGSDRVQGLYLGSVPYDGYYLGSSPSEDKDYGVDRYADWPVATDTAAWTVNQAEFGYDAPAVAPSDRGISMRQGNFDGGFNVGLDVSGMLVGREYEVKVKLNAGSSYSMAFQISQGGAADAGSLEASVAPGDSYKYAFTCTDSDFGISIFRFGMPARAWLYIQYIWVREIS